MSEASKQLPENRGKSRGGNPPEEYRFKSGQSGNPGGRPKEIFRTVALQKLTKLVRKGKIEQSAIEHVLEAQVKRAMSGNTEAFKALRDTVDGRPQQTLEHTGNIIHEITELEKRKALGSVEKMKALEVIDVTPIDATPEEASARD
jgi:hypothetical protein